MSGECDECGEHATDCKCNCERNIFMCMCDDVYNKMTIIQNKYGIIFSSHVPIDWFSEIAKVFSKMYGYDIFDGIIATHYKASACLTTNELSDKWRKELKLDDQ